MDSQPTAPVTSPLSRRAVLGGVAAWLAIERLWASRAAATQTSRPGAATGRPWSLEDFVANIRSGGPPKDGIPPIDRPRYVPASDAERFLRSGDVVFGLEYRGVVKAYPQKILVWHEIVNEEIAGDKLAVTYCPLTGSTVAFRGRSRPDGAPLTFGTTGKLVNSNLLMYDRQTDSEWPQILGAAIRGPNKGAALEEIPLAWTTWELWRSAQPRTTVLSTETGFFRAYGSDPYGSYERQGTYYDSGGTFFPTMASDPRFPAKHVVIGIKVGEATLAIPRLALGQQKVLNTILAGVPLVVLWDDALAAGRVFSRRVGRDILTFRRDADRVLDDRTGSAWAPTGRCREGKLSGTELPVVAAYDVMWFAWYAFFPRTEVWGTARG